MAKLKVQSHTVCLLLGSNIMPESNMKQAFYLLREKVYIQKFSSVWQTKAVGSSGPDFFNAALIIKTDWNANELKENVLHPIETKLGRVRVEDKNAPRTIDIDIIIFDNILFDKELWKHAHAAVPVSEVLPFYQSEDGIKLIDKAALLSKSTSISLVPNIFDTIKPE